MLLDLSYLLTLIYLIQSIRYTYYHLASKEGASKVIWWKKYLTILQIVQFVVFLLHAIQGLFLINCPNFPVTISVMVLANAMFFIKTFTDFFIRTYKDNKNNNDISKDRLKRQ